MPAFDAGVQPWTVTEPGALQTCAGSASQIALFLIVESLQLAPRIKDKGGGEGLRRDSFGSRACGVQADLSLSVKIKLEDGLLGC